MKEAFSGIRVHLNTFRLLEEKDKDTPTIMDRFGWCTWNALYLTVDPLGVWHVVNDFAEGGVPLKFLIIDNGWQSINLDGEDPNQDSKNLVNGGEQMIARLHRRDEGEKFRKYKANSLLSPNTFLSYDHMRLIAVESECKDGEHGMKAFTRDLRTKFRVLDDIWVWQALCGAWGGVRPRTTHLNSKIFQCNSSPGLAGTMEDAAVDKIIEAGIRLVHPDQATVFYDSVHSYLVDARITGVKVDVIHMLEYVSEEYGGRVELAKCYYNGLTKSLKNFKGKNMLSSMQQCNDFLFLGTKQISMGRVADNFWEKDPYGDPEGVFWLQGVHMVHCSYNSLWMGQMIHPDWDMFQSVHVCARVHAGSRAICGGPIYVSDSLGCHDFDLLKKLVYPDGTLWNINKYGGVIGEFNCQGAGWDGKERKFKGYKHCYKTIQGSIHVNDIRGLKPWKWVMLKNIQSISTKLTQFS